MLSIVIPYFKLLYFESTLKSLATQSNKNFRVYIGDDSSPYNPNQLLDKFSNRFDFIYKRFETNLGGVSLVKQWERCIDLITDEEWILILGDDDVLADNVVEEFYKNLPNIENEGTNVVRFATCKIDRKGERTSGIYHNPQIESSIDFLFRGSRSSLSEYVFKTKKVKEIGFRDFPLAWFSDVLAVLEFSDFKNIFSISEAIVYIRISEESISGSTTNLKLKSKAGFEYYYYLLCKKNSKFNTLQVEILLNKISSYYLNDKRNILYFIKISILYFKNLQFKNFLVFLKAIYSKLIKIMSHKFVKNGFINQ